MHPYLHSHYFVWDLFTKLTFSKGLLSVFSMPASLTIVADFQMAGAGLCVILGIPLAPVLPGLLESVSTVCDVAMLACAPIVLGS